MLQRTCFLLNHRTRSSPGAHIITDAWHTVLNSDPLVDSDEECPDEHLRLDYSGPLRHCMLVVYAHLSYRSANAGDNTSTRTTPNSPTRGVQPGYTNLARIPELSVQNWVFVNSLLYPDWFVRNPDRISCAMHNFKSIS
jgi:hypothetical protein